jgi:hypothetical protein
MSFNTLTFSSGVGHLRVEHSMAQHDSAQHGTMLREREVGVNCVVSCCVHPYHLCWDLMMCQSACNQQSALQPSTAGQGQIGGRFQHQALGEEGAC